MQQLTVEPGRLQRPCIVYYETTLGFIKDLAAEGRTMILVTHDMRLARDVSDHVVFLHQGRIEEEGHPEALFDNPQSERLQQFLSHTTSI